MGLSARTVWGHHRARFELPHGGVWFTGLDEDQLTALQSTYPGFVDGASRGSEADRSEIECRAYRLTEAPKLPATALARDGQYAPRAIHGPDGIDLTGVNFEARVPLHPSHAPGWVGVLKSDELAQPNVIENFLRVYSAHQALRRGGVVLHSAGLVLDDQAYLFAGRSGAGKTTLTRKGHQAGAQVLSDDINLVLPGAGGYEAHAVPFTGEFGRTLAHPGGRGAYPVAGLVLLERGERLCTQPVRPSGAFARLLAACPFVNMDAAQSAPLFEALARLMARVPVIGLRCRRDDGFETIMNQVSEGIAHASTHG